MTSQFINVDPHSESGFRAWHFTLPALGKTSVLLESGSGDIRSVLDADDISVVLELKRNGADALRIVNWHSAMRKESIASNQMALLSMLDLLFCNEGGLQEVILNNELAEFLDAGLARDHIITRKRFYQWPVLWLSNAAAYPVGLEITETDGVRHPLRPAQPLGEMYRRFVPSVNKTLTFKAVDPVADLDLVHAWMNHPRIAPVWELGVPKAQLQQYLLGRVKDPHIFSVLGYFDNEAFGYFEVYWTLEDRLGPYYDAQDFDRGLHLLVGNPAYLGTDFFNAWFTGLTHFMFLDEPRTMNVMGEPRADNKVLLKHLQTVPSYHLLKEFDFPHKRAALVECTRERFFDLINMP